MAAIRPLITAGPMDRGASPASTSESSATCARAGPGTKKKSAVASRAALLGSRLIDRLPIAAGFGWHLEVFVVDHRVDFYLLDDVALGARALTAHLNGMGNHQPTFRLVVPQHGDDVHLLPLNGPLGLGAERQVVLRIQVVERDVAALHRDFELERVGTFHR